ncbi:N-6 DNA methylase [Kangiella aquimarina]|uniref:N-6 DNA methylase n=1 Tax=Kangiella aquimarina TaxID=261965 RepID=A0ABZ0X4N8_9GAMM|nr:N-6 DNA methylase [Kangiella aquimarina]WQG85480.1 N-6 DNA methylase [Kangiella aquimarina]
MYTRTDQYFTPLLVAKELLELAEFPIPRHCVDPTCGSGNLLIAASTLYSGNIKISGIDRDIKIINSLRKAKPHWRLSVADLLNPQSMNKTSILRSKDDCDLLLLNPPFSQAKGKHVLVNFKGVSIKCSTAMGYILKSLEIFEPEYGILAIVPESLLFSEVDEASRAVLGKYYEIQVLKCLESKTFHSATVHTVAIKLVRKTKLEESLSGEFYFSSDMVKANVEIIRGGLQVHSVEEFSSDTGAQFVHTKNIKDLICGGESQKQFVSCSKKGIIKGRAILLPRVGIPKMEHIEILNFERDVHLSDCVLAIINNDKEQLENVKRIIISNWSSFKEQYKGTGAKYITLRRLRDWFKRNNIIA